MFRRVTLAGLSAVLATTLVAAGPAAQQPPGGIDHEAEFGIDAPFEYAGATDTGGVVVWTHLSLWDGNTCYSDSPDNKCDRILVHAMDKGEVTITMDATYDVADYDMVVFRSGPSGDAFSAMAHSQNEIFVEGEGPIPLPGDEQVTFETDADSWYLIGIFYRAAGGGYTLTGEIAPA